MKSRPSKSFPLFLIAVIGLVSLISACNSKYTAKPRGYFAIDFPEKKYQLFNESGYPYSFEYPVYGKIIRDESFFDAKPENPWWINVDFPQFRGRIYISYKDVNQNNFDSLVSDAFELAYKQHTYKASAIEPEPFETPKGLSGVYFSLEGNTATANQFFVTDSTRHFLRGALYFDAAPNADSLGIVNDFLKQDLRHLINSLEWR